jgi:hypothetical protein
MSGEATKESLITRRTWVAVLLITLIVAVPAFMLGPIIWPPGPAPTSAPIPYFLAMDVLKAVFAVFLGLGISFLIFGLPVIRRISPDSKMRVGAMYLSIGYLMVSWWPHINMHAHNAPDDLQGLLYIRHLFHVPLIISGAVLAYCFISLVRQRARMPIAPR